MFPDFVEDIIKNSLTWIITGVAGPIILTQIGKRISPLRNWLAGHPWAQSTLIASFAAVIFSGLMWTLLPPRATGGFDPGFVVAYNSRAGVNALSEQCPKGWEPFEQGRGRFLVGAGSPANTEFNMWRQVQQDGSERQLLLTTRDPFAQGGEESHTLALAEMPEHFHDVNAPREESYANPSDTYGSGGGKIGPVNTRPAGSNAPHNNLPPFVAVYFCVKT